MFMELIRYVDYIREERVKIHSFIGGIPLSYRGRIEFSNPWTLEGAILIMTCCNEKRKTKVKVKPSWKVKFKKGFENKNRELMCPYARDLSRKGQRN